MFLALNSRFLRLTLCPKALHNDLIPNQIARDRQQKKGAISAALLSSASPDSKPLCSLPPSDLMPQHFHTHNKKVWG